MCELAHDSHADLDTGRTKKLFPAWGLGAGNDTNLHRRQNGGRGDAPPQPFSRPTHPLLPCATQKQWTYLSAIVLSQNMLVSLLLSLKSTVFCLLSIIISFELAWLKIFVHGSSYILAPSHSICFRRLWLVLTMTVTVCTLLPNWMQNIKAI